MVVLLRYNIGAWGKIPSGHYKSDCRITAVDGAASTTFDPAIGL